MAAAHKPGSLPVWQEFAEAGAGAGQDRPEQLLQPAQPPLGSTAARWLAAIARHCESAEGAQAKASLNQLLRCGSRARDKVVAVANRARQAIGVVFSWTRHADDPPDINNPARARECMYLFERCLHGALLAALQQEARAQEGINASPGIPAAGQDEEMQQADAEGALASLEAAGGGAAAPSAACAGGRSARVTVSSLTPAQQDRVVEQMVQGAEIQLGLVNACIEVVNYAHLRSREHAFPWATLQLSRLHSTLELWQGCDWVCDFTENGIVGAEGTVPGIPEDVAEYLAAIQVRIEEELAFIDSSSIFGRIVAVGATWGQDASSDKVPGSNPSGKRPSARRGSTYVRQGSDAALVARFLSNLARTAMLRTCSVCQVMTEEFPQLSTICPELGARACVVMDLLLAENLELLFGQHISVAIACAIYFTLRLHNQMLPFRKITGLMAEVLPNHDEQTFMRVELPPLDGSGWDGSHDYGDTRAARTSIAVWYNTIFLNAFSQYDTSVLFGEAEGLAPTPSKAALEAPQVEQAQLAQPVEPRLLDAAAKPAACLAAAGGAVLASSGWGDARTASGGSKPEKGKLRKPLGKLDNRGSGKGGVLRAR